MKITHVSTSLRGGAGIAAVRLNDALVDHEVNSKTVDKSFINQNSLRFFIRKLSEKLSAISERKLNLTKEYECLSFEKNHFPGNFSSIFESDIIHLHWVASFIDYSSFFKDKSLPSIVWTLHDMNPFLGLAHYLEDAKMLRRELSNGQEFHELRSNDKDYQVWSRKKKILERLPNNKIHFVSPSKWLAEEAQKSFINRFPISVIPNGIDITVLKPIEVQTAKRILNIPMNKKKTILFVADSLKNTRKGMDVLVRSLSSLKDEETYQILIMGRDFNDRGISIPVVNLGYIFDDRLKSCVYSSADLFVIPSREDNLPNTVLESLACGTPVIGANTGGIPEMVRPGLTGELFEVGDSLDLAQKIETWFERDDLEDISKKCREVAVKEYDVKLQAQRYKELYEKILADNE